MLDLSAGLSRHRANLDYVPGGFTMKHMALLSVLTFASSLFAATMSHEEAVVRQAYAKLAYAADVNSVQQVIDSYDAPDQINIGEAMQKIAERKLHFELSDFKTGNIEDIKGYYDDYVAEPDGSDVLAVSQDTFTIEENKVVTTCITANVRWTNGDRTVAHAWKVPAVNWLSRQVDGVTYQRYASYRVILKFQGRERDYRALAVFAPPEKNKPEEILFVDLITGNSPLTFFAKRQTDVSPNKLTHNRTNPIVEEWLRKNQPPSTN
jgi:hypothetical protein